jgi:hypothetical protein
VTGIAPGTCNVTATDPATRKTSIAAITVV